MKIIVGLGNPGSNYEQTRHNAGWLVLDSYLGQKTGWEQKFHSEILRDGEVVFIKPQTFMNESGTTVSQIANFYKIDPSRDLLVIHDEVDLPFGTIRTTSSSSPAGHNGVKDIIEKLGTQDFYRIRIGVESRPSRDIMPTDAFVLQNFTDEELNKLNKEIFPKVKMEIEKFLLT